MEKFIKAVCNTKCFFEGYIRDAGKTYVFPASVKLDQHFDIVVNPGAEKEVTEKEAGIKSVKVEDLKRPELMKLLKKKGVEFSVKSSNKELIKLIKES